MNTSYQKRMAAKILKCGSGRVKVSQEKDIEEALTRNDVRHLIVKGLIRKVQKKGTGRIGANKKLAQKKKGRSGGRGTKRGKKFVLVSRKETWMRNIRAQRSLLKELKEKGLIENAVYNKFYRRAKGGEYRNKKHMLSFLKENNLIKSKKKEKAGGKNA
jgi:large subunit ribosomal protein L19e